MRRCSGVSSGCGERRLEQCLATPPTAVAKPIAPSLAAVCMPKLVSISELELPWVAFNAAGIAAVATGAIAAYVTWHYVQTSKDNKKKCSQLFCVQWTMETYCR